MLIDRLRSLAKPDASSLVHSVWHACCVSLRATPQEVFPLAHELLSDADAASLATEFEQRKACELDDHASGNVLNAAS
jgi:hypothetical protein